MSAAPIAPMLATAMRGAIGTDLPVAIEAWDGSRAGPADAPAVVIRNRRALRRLLWRPDELGLARAYVTGDLDVRGDLADGLRRIWDLARREQVDVHAGVRERLTALGTVSRLGALGLPPRPPASEAHVRGRLHSRDRDRAVISHHYDLSNDFYALVLDEHMAYSCAYYGDGAADAVSLEAAQTAKFEMVCGKLGLRPGQRLLDVGCGWGSLSIHAARHHGVKVLGVTISREQRDFARKRAAEVGVADLVDVQLLDYRDLAHDSFDAAASLEMGEHVGDAQYPEYLAAVRRALAPGAPFLLQQMSRAADAAPGGGPFIEAYIAPDMHMRPLGDTVGLVEAGGFEVLGVQALREHYVRTGAAWLERLEARWAEVVALVGEEVARVWRLYLVGGSLAFEERRMGVDQLLLRAPATLGT